MAAELPETTTFLVSIDRKGSEMERPFMRFFREARTADEAKRLAERDLDEGEVVREAVPFQPILDAVLAKIAEGVPHYVSFKHESGSEGPVVIIDRDAQAADKTGPFVPFGSETPYHIVLPWMHKREAKRLAKYLGADYGES